MSDLPLDSELIVDGSWGIYVPQVFAKHYLSSEHLPGVTEEEYAILLAGPDHEFYWDTWADVLDDFDWTDDDGIRWYLYQDGDLFVCPVTYDECED